MVKGMISSNSFTLMEASVVYEGDLLTGVVEFKKSQFSKDQTLAEMLCTMTDCCVDQLKNAKQIKKAIVYGLAVDYTAKKAQVFKLTLDFMKKCSDIKMLREELTLTQSMNFLITVLSN